ncbi:MAG: response regulator, partial [Propionibacteriaceae bacterium]|nr:response regulator [Propionibacteriaceae bacterium]
MSHRRILLVDTDRAFHQLLEDQLGPYGFEIVATSPTEGDVLARVPQLEPALIVIAVDEPDKVGYALCNKAKKGVAASIPVILVTATVTPKSFANHRKIKIHADEYIDKRGLNPAEVVGKIDNLIGLGEAELDELHIPVEVDDVAIDLADAVEVEVEV